MRRQHLRGFLHAVAQFRLELPVTSPNACLLERYACKRTFVVASKPSVMPNFQIAEHS